MIKLFSRQSQKPNHNDDFKQEVQRERLRQSKYSFNVAVGAIATSYFVTLLGVGLLYTDKIAESTFTTATGTIFSFISMTSANAKKQELQALLDELAEKS